MTRNILRACVLIASCGAFMPSAAIARSPYDGSWSVMFYTRSGACNAAYRSGVIIQNSVIYPEGGGINLNGRISSNGAVRATVSAGGQYASGSGRLDRYSGSGVWRGQGSGGSCSGTWAAQRRG
jgi:hypothetical protein